MNIIYSIIRKIIYIFYFQLSKHKFKTVTFEETVTIKKKLLEEGVVLIKNTYFKNNVELFNNIDKDYCSQRSINIPNSYSYYYEDLVSLALANSQSVIEHRGFPVVSRLKKRTTNHSADKGISDVFFAKYILSKTQNNIIENTIRPLDRIMAELGYKRSSYINIYLYDSVYTPRCFHSDYMLDRYKVFLYLDTILDIKDGPYAYLVSSHRYFFSLLQKITRFILKPVFGNNLGYGTWDGLLFDSKLMTPIFLESGDIVITNNRGIHGDFPAARPFKRRVIVLHYS